MKTTRASTALPLLAFALLTGSARLAAQALPAADAAAAADARPAIQFTVEAETVVPTAAGGRLILQRVAQPVLPPPPPVVTPTVLTPEQRAARLAARRAASPRPKETRLLWFHVTVHDDGASYIEWWPDGGGGRYAAWSRADFRYMNMIPDFDLENTDTRYLLFPSVLLRPRPGSAPAEHPAIPADGPGFVLVKGDPANTRAVAPIAAMHQSYLEEFSMLKTNYEQREATRAAEAALPPPPPGDVVVKFWPLRTEAAPTPAPAAR